MALDIETINRANDLALQLKALRQMETMLEQDPKRSAWLSVKETPKLQYAPAYRAPITLSEILERGRGEQDSYVGCKLSATAALAAIQAAIMVVEAQMRELGVEV